MTAHDLMEVRIRKKREVKTKAVKTKSVKKYCDKARVKKKKPFYSNNEVYI
jgi:hypothetical protein